MAYRGSIVYSECLAICLVSFTSYGRVQRVRATDPGKSHLAEDNKKTESVSRNMKIRCTQAQPNYQHRPRARAALAEAEEHRHPLGAQGKVTSIIFKYITRKREAPEAPGSGSGTAREPGLRSKRNTATPDKRGRLPSRPHRRYPSWPREQTTAGTSAIKKKKRMAQVQRQRQSQA